MDPWFLVLVSVGSVIGFVFFSTAIVAQFGDVSQFPTWSRACVVARAATIPGRVGNSLVYALMAPASVLVVAAVVADAVRIQNSAAASFGVASIVAIAAWVAFLLRPLARLGRGRAGTQSSGRNE